MQCPQGVTLPQFRNALARYRDEYGVMPASPEALVAYVAIKEQEERESFVRVAFTGGMGLWTYQVMPGPPIRVGDFLKVHGSWTHRGACVDGTDVMAGERPS